ncbi:hypothetical protein E8E11_000108 [Didymella keratinophila]|nr:hypothetical protein E8E11_000108 [Didymella keratinophila]
MLSRNATMLEPLEQSVLAEYLDALQLLIRPSAAYGYDDTTLSLCEGVACQPFPPKGLQVCKAHIHPSKLTAPSNLPLKRGPQYIESQQISRGMLNLMVKFSFIWSGEVDISDEAALAQATHDLKSLCAKLQRRKVFAVDASRRSPASCEETGVLPAQAPESDISEDQPNKKQRKQNDLPPPNSSICKTVPSPLKMIMRYSKSSRVSLQPHGIRFPLILTADPDMREHIQRPHLEADDLHERVRTMRLSLMMMMVVKAHRDKRFQCLLLECHIRAEDVIKQKVDNLEAQVSELVSQKSYLETRIADLVRENGTREAQIGVLADRVAALQTQNDGLLKVEQGHRKLKEKLQQDEEALALLLAMFGQSKT